jgi:hypothetical protein
VQMSAHHGVDPVTRPARLAKMLQERRRQRLAALRDDFMTVPRSRPG